MKNQTIKDIYEAYIAKGDYKRLATDLIKPMLAVKGLKESTEGILMSIAIT